MPIVAMRKYKNRVPILEAPNCSRFLALVLEREKPESEAIVTIQNDFEAKL